MDNKGKGKASESNSTTPVDVDGAKDGKLSDSPPSVCIIAIGMAG